MEVSIAYTHSQSFPLHHYEVAEPESDEEDFTGDDYRDGDSDYDVENDNDAQNYGEKHSRNLMKSSFG